MSKKLLLLLILLLSLFLRFYRLGEFPATLYGDEQAFAWNAYNILKTGKDEYGIPHPLQFRSFNDYKAPIPVYLLVPFIKYITFKSLSLRQQRYSQMFLTYILIKSMSSTYLLLPLHIVVCREIISNNVNLPQNKQTTYSR